MQDQSLELGGESPLSSYRLLSLTFNAGLMALACSRPAARALAKPLALGDFALAAAATYKLAQVITKERVTMAIRAPFTWQRDHGRTGGRKEVPKEHGLSRAIGELLTCPYCMAPWISTALIAGYVFAPIPTRVATTVFAIAAASDWLTHLDKKLDDLPSKSDASAKADPIPRVVSAAS